MCNYFVILQRIMSTVIYPSPTLHSDESELSSGSTKSSFIAWIKSSFKKNLWTKLGYLHVRKGMKEMSETMDYKSVGGAMLLGINGIVVKAHGNSDAYSFKNALRVAKEMANYDIVFKIGEAFKHE